MSPYQQHIKIMRFPIKQKNHPSSAPTPGDLTFFQPIAHPVSIPPTRTFRTIFPR